MLENAGDFIINCFTAIGDFFDNGINFYIACIILFSLILGNILLFIRRK